MTEESDAGDGAGEGEGGAVDDESVDSEVESTVSGSAGAGEATGDDGSQDGAAAGEDDATAIGAVTDAEDPPDESAPGVGEGDDETHDGGDTADGVPADDGETTFDASESMDAGEWAEEVAESSSEVDSVGVGADTEAVPSPDPADAAASEDAADAAMPGGSHGGFPDEGTYPEGPPDDQEMPLADHIEEMVLRLAVVCGIATVVAGTVFFFEPLAENVIMFIWDSVIPSPSVEGVPNLVGGTTWPGHFVVENVTPSNPRVYGPLELKLTELKFASLVGFVAALPVFVYETYRFMRPGLYPHERRYYLAAVPTSLVLAFVGVSFAYFIILPAIFAYFVRYSERAGLLAFALRQTFDLILVLMGYMALVFQIPLFIMLAIMMGLTDRQWLESRRLYFWGGFLGVSFLFVPEPTGMAPILVALTMIGLFEGTLALLRWTGN
jgi:sec-independent protein translocase protein TatC